MSSYLTLDSIIKSVLLKKGYPLHFYLQYMISARDIVQTLIYDDGLMPPNTVLLDVDNNGYAQLPKDFIDDIQVGICVGQYVRPLVRKDELNCLPHLEIPNNETNGANSIIPWGYIPNLFYSTSYFNEHGEFLGRMNIGAGIENDVYKIIPERCVIYCSRYLTNQKIVLTYLSNGNCGCKASMGIDHLAKDVIEAYIQYDKLRNSRNATLGERQLAEQEYFRQRKVYRARKSKLGIDEIRRIVQRAYYLAPKTS